MLQRVRSLVHAWRRSVLHTHALLSSFIVSRTVARSLLLPRGQTCIILLDSMLAALAVCASYEGAVVQQIQTSRTTVSGSPTSTGTGVAVPSSSRLLLESSVTSVRLSGDHGACCAAVGCIER
jgi:hypothetical protein